MRREFDTTTEYRDLCHMPSSASANRAAMSSSFEKSGHKEDSRVTEEGEKEGAKKKNEETLEKLNKQKKETQ